MAGEQAAAEHADVLPLDDAVMRTIAAGFEPASSAPEESVTYTTGHDDDCKRKS